MNVPVGKFVAIGEEFGKEDNNAENFPVAVGKSVKDTATFARTSLDSSPKDGVS